MRALFLLSCLVITFASAQNSTCASFNNDCASCTFTTGCLYCPATSQCVSSFSFNNTSSCPNNGTVSSCPCSDYKDCYNCTSTVGGFSQCGWCDVNNSDKSGSCIPLTGNTTDVPEGCTAKHWASNGLDCPGVKKAIEFLGMGILLFSILSVLACVCCFCVIPGIIIFLCIKCASSNKTTHHHHQTTVSHGHKYEAVPQM